METNEQQLSFPYIQQGDPDTSTVKPVLLTDQTNFADQDENLWGTVKTGKPAFDEEAFNRAVEIGTRAWADVPDISQWVAEQRGAE